jgi:hypothetical protein
MNLKEAEQSCPPGIVSRFKQKIILGRLPMSSPWDPAIAQAMQRHGGSNRSIPRTQSTPVKNEFSGSIAVVQSQVPVQGPVQEKTKPSGKPDNSGLPDTPEAA